ncbi:formate/nitrite transporter family protein [Gephyromycinifex aptenodytis]|uniref:formate/nitrite transporter family protein n=1 Tax=Gephyromycinifex aptenodytis TaxID=2716227 RepID=UPI0014450845|nr:formate/nitrite transporter family protein [Gephyromycinifex aptenodytis]
MTDPRNGTTQDRVEEEVQNSHDASIQEGNERLTRSWRVLVSTGFLGGVEISFGVLAFVFTLEETGSHLLAALAFSIGFIALFLAHSELFTEGFFYPIMGVFYGEGSLGQLLRLWGTTFVMNLFGGWVTMWLIVQAFPELHATLATLAHGFVDTPFGLRSASLAVLAGAGITLMTRMQAGAESDIAGVAAAVGGAYLLAGMSLFHSVLDTLLIFGALISGASELSYLDWLGWVWWVAALNMLGGLAFITLPRILRSSELKET